MGTVRDTVFNEIEPRNSLRDYVDGLWYSIATAPHTLHILPTTRSVLMTCKTPYGSGIVLVGPMSEVQHVVMEQGDTKIGVWLKPGARYLFQSHESHELRNKVVVGRDMSRLIRECEHAITNIRDPFEKLECLQDCIDELIRRNMIVRDTRIDTFIAAAQSSGGRATVHETLLSIPMSYRQFSRQVKHYTGFTAKEFLQLQRLNTAAHALDESKTTVSAIAADHDYADHAHFTRDFRSRVGVSPSAFGEQQSL